MGPGSVGVLQQIITGLCDAGDEVIFAWRSFEAYLILVELAGARPVRVPLDAAEGHDLDAMAAAVTARTNLPARRAARVSGGCGPALRAG